MKRMKFLLGAASVTLAPAASLAAILATVPMQGGMVMPMISYNEADGTLQVMLDPTVPQLTPLLVSNPADGFDPADPWFDSLDPGRQGLAFSRRYGFVMDTMTDPLPANTQIWIRKVSGSPGLSAYRYRDTAPKAWEPVFGTSGVTNALYWNGMMFHPAFTVPPGTNTSTATFEAYLLDTLTGQEVAGSSTGPFVFNWTSVPDGRPTLAIVLNTPGVIVFWPATTSTNWVLESADSLSAPNWTTVTSAPVPWNGQTGVLLDGSAAQKFFRMRHLP
jgi:hypothetical protein